MFKSKHTIIPSYHYHRLYDNILSAITQDKALQEHLYYLTDHQLLDTSRLLLKDRKSILLANNLCTCILQYYYNHILTRHFRQNKTPELIYCDYTWPSLHADIKSFCNSYVTCMKSRLQYHKSYRSFKQLLILK